MVLIAVILILLLFGNWFINLSLIFIPVDFATRVTSFGWWILAFIAVLFLAWCVGEE